MKTKDQNAVLLKGLMPVNWKAKWIDPEHPHDAGTRQPASVLKKTFCLPEKFIGPGSSEDASQTLQAILYITCHGLYEARLNGERIGDAVLMPGTGDYTKRLFIQAYDVTDMLRFRSGEQGPRAENTLMVTLGDGWYRGSVGIDGLTNYYGTDIALLCQLEISGEPVVVTDETWKATQAGPVRENDLQQGEGYDARLYDHLEGSDPSVWHTVTLRDFDLNALTAMEGVPIREQECFSGRFITTPDGSTVIDFGQNLAGYTEFKLKARSGQKITLWHGETLDEQGNFTQKNFDPGDRNKNGIPQKIEYICKEGLNIYKPHFTVFGFRYVKVETDIDLKNAEFTAIALYSDMRKTGFFECGNADVNRLFLNSLWSMKSNFLDIPTDCPTRERAGWTGDAEVFAPTAVYLMDCLPVYRKWLGECRIAQGKEGLVQNIAPVNNSGSMISNLLQGSAGWGDACIIVPYVLYETYGDLQVLKENYEMMTKWMDFCEKRYRKTHLNHLKNPYKKYLADQGFHFGEWCQPDVDNGAAMKANMTGGAAEVATAYYYRSASLLSEIAKILGKDQDAEKYAVLSENIRKAYRYQFVSDGRIHSDRQCEYVRPLAFGLLDEEEAQSAAADLNRLVQEKDYHLNTGFLSTPDLLKVLSDHGYTETAYRLLLQEDRPGWLYTVKKGATTIWETWDGVREDGTVHDSLNHYSYGAVSGWLFKGAAGMELKGRTLTLSPKPDPVLKYVKARWDSPAGRIESEWHYEEDGCHYRFTVPEGVEATFTLPDGRTERLNSGVTVI